MKWVLLGLVVLNVSFLGWRLQAQGQPAPAPVAVSHSAHVNRLLLLSEIDAGELRVRPPADAADSDGRSAQQPAQPGPPPGSCFSIGPLEAEGEIEQIGEWLSEHGAQASLRAGERRELALYWIHFPPFDSRDAAEERVAEMRAKQIDDIFIINRGDMARAVSLGVYSRKSSLDRRLAELERKGYQPEVTVRYRQKKASWYDARFEADYEFPAERFTSVFPGAQVHEAPCAATVARIKASGLLPRGRGEEGASPRPDQG